VPLQREFREFTAGNLFLESLQSTEGTKEKKKEKGKMGAVVWASSQVARA